MTIPEPMKHAEQWERARVEDCRRQGRGIRPSDVRDAYADGYLAGMERAKQMLGDARDVLDSFAEHTISRNNAEQLAAEWVEAYDAAIRAEAAKEAHK